MYLWEWLVYEGRDSADDSELARSTEVDEKARKSVPLATVKERFSGTATENDSLYAYNDTFIDVRTPSDEKRGLITLFLGIGGMAWLGVCLYAVLLPFRAFLHGERDFYFGFYFFCLTALVVALGSFFVYVKYLFRYLRLEAFTARRLVVRFNRITRKVYLLRPKNIGGIVALDWDKTQAAVDPSMRHEVLPGGGFLILSWDAGAVYDADGKLTDDFDGTFVGRTARNGAELLAFWEYIRRYMEIGPEAAPPPKKLLSKTPWPWLSFEAAWNILPLRGLRESGMWPMFVLVKLMLLPVTLIHATGHWISLLLCYEPKFPPSIENAGK
ncbi:DUF6708 domain-containing protein [Paraburkholderia tropica]|uniref:DUF6708 domain-containing protein n=1 Tax=Paraburkholderia tropica TaxID=92647 RepID=UPI002AB7A4E9|nr:DUF6708 domain-containing protein [Paraburkholderia tropica]